MKPLCFLPIILCAATLTAAHSGDNTTRRRLSVDKSRILRTETASLDTLTDDSLTSNIILSGFDKPLRSTNETLFVRNMTGTDISGLVIELEYSDSKGRQLHKRTVTKACDIPAGETRQICFRSWDRQQSFHYRLSPRPRRADGTPFDVTCTVKAVIVNRTAQNR